MVIDLRATRERDGHTVLHDLAWAGNVQCARLVLDTHMCDDMLEARNRQGQTALHVAAFRSAKVIRVRGPDCGALRQCVPTSPYGLRVPTSPNLS